MSSATEQAFRTAERVLDSLVDNDSTRLAKNEIEFMDMSVRRYYRDPLLSWVHRFRHQIPRRNAEIAMVTVSLTYQEPLDMTSQQSVSITTLSEVFQTGQLSRWEQTSKSTISIDELSECGLANFLLDLFKHGHEEIDSNLPT